MKSKAVVFVDIDESEFPCYSYREPHFKIAQELGLTCVTIAKSNRGFLSRLNRYSDRVVFLKELSEKSLADAVLELSSELAVLALFCYAGHAGPDGQIGVTVAKVCQKLGLNYSSPDAISACNDKYLMREMLRDSGVPSVSYALCHTEKEITEGAIRIGYPLVAKPRFGARPAFIKKCSNEQELLSHYRYYQSHFCRALSKNSFGHCEGEGDVRNTPGATLLLEEWIEGVEGSVECVMTNSQIFPLIINEKLLLTNRVGTILEDLLISPPSSFSPTQQQAIRNYAKKCISALMLDSAIAHLEFKMTNRGPIVIEINPRLGGLYVSSAFIDISGVDPWKIYLDILLGSPTIETQLSLAMKKATKNIPHYSMIALYPDRSGLYKGIESTQHLECNPKILEFELLPSGVQVNAEAEENYLLKCWARVEGSDDAQLLYQEVSKNTKPILE